MNPDKRLLAIINEIPPSSVIADIGTDHGIVAVEAKLRGLADKVIAADISASSLKKAAALASAHGADIDIRPGDGVSVLSVDEYDTLVIAGMGGLEIVSILRSAAKLFNHMVLSPHSKAYELRRCLCESGYRIDRDYKIESRGKFYDIITASQGRCNLGEFELHYGKSANTPIFEQFCVKERARLKRILEGNENEKIRELLKLLDLHKAEGKK